jgi:hypothetical protein
MLYLEPLHLLNCLVGEACAPELHVLLAQSRTPARQHLQRFSQLRILLQQFVVVQA